MSPTVQREVQQQNNMLVNSERETGARYIRKALPLQHQRRDANIPQQLKQIAAIRHHTDHQLSIGPIFLLRNNNKDSYKAYDKV